MSPGIYLLDTNVAIALLRNQATAVRRTAEAERLFLSAVVAGELYLGAESPAAPAGERGRVDELVAATALLACDVETARVYARLKYDLRRRGTPIPDNDLWIAATAVRYDLTLATRDRHFEAVGELHLDRWE